MVTPQQRGQVIVKSIGDINRESTVRARPMGSRAMGGVAAGIAAGQNIAGVFDTVKTVGSNISKVGGVYHSFAFSKANFMLMGLALGNETTRGYVVPAKGASIMSNLITMKYVASLHILYSVGGVLFNTVMGRK
jgi:hypothetical protein